MSLKFDIELEQQEGEYEKLLRYINTHRGNPRKSAVSEQVEKATKAIYLTQKTSLKIALLVNAITKKQSPALRRWTGRVKPDADVLSFQEYLTSMRKEEDLWSKVCESSVGQSETMKKELAEHPEVLRAMGV